MYLLIYPSQRFRKAGAIESVDKLEDIVIQQVCDGIVRVVRLKDGVYQELCQNQDDDSKKPLKAKMIWREVKTMLIDTKDVEEYS
jgi:hypothetical protein